MLPCQEMLSPRACHLNSLYETRLWCSHRRDVAIVETVSNCLQKASKRLEHKQEVVHTDLMALSHLCALSRRLLCALDVCKWGLLRPDQST